MQKKKKSTRRLTPFGIAVKKKLLDLGMTQKELAHKVGSSGKYLDLVLHGVRPVSIYIDRIAEYLDIDLEDFQKVS